MLRIYVFMNRGLGNLAHWFSGRVFTNGSRDRGSISGRCIQNTQEVVLDNSFFNTQHYMVRFKGKVE